jgi:hypothetical protein
LAVPNVEPAALPDRWPAPLAERLAGRQLKGLVVSGDHLVAVVASEQELAFTPRRLPMTMVSAERDINGIAVVSAAGTATLHGRGFAPGVPVAVELWAGEVATPIRLQAQPGRDGTFEIALTTAGGPGARHVLASQQDGLRLIRTAAVFQVLRTEADDVDAREGGGRDAERRTQSRMRSTPAGTRITSINTRPSAAPAQP